MSPRVISVMRRGAYPIYEVVNVRYVDRQGKYRKFSTRRKLRPVLVIVKSAKGDVKKFVLKRPDSRYAYRLAYRKKPVTLQQAQQKMMRRMEKDKRGSLLEIVRDGVTYFAYLSNQPIAPRGKRR